MSNPGVIKLAKEKCGQHTIWLDDNIGESIHIHIDQFRIDLSVEGFLCLCSEIQRILEDLIDIPYLDVGHMDKRFFYDIADKLEEIDRVEFDNVAISEIMVKDDDKICKLEECDRVKALMELKDIDNTRRRYSNYIGQSNRQRLDEALNFVKVNGYPYRENYITIDGTNMAVLDGWHRAAALYYLYGDIEIPVKKIYFKNKLDNYKFFFPFGLIPLRSKIILFGAGNMGKEYYKQLIQNTNIELIAWMDSKYKEIESIDDVKICNPREIKELEYDCVVIAVVNNEVHKQIEKMLVELGVDPNKIVV